MDPLPTAIHYLHCVFDSKMIAVFEWVKLAETGCLVGSFLSQPARAL